MAPASVAVVAGRTQTSGSGSPARAAACRLCSTCARAVMATSTRRRSPSRRSLRKPHTVCSAPKGLAAATSRATAWATSAAASGGRVRWRSSTRSAGSCRARMAGPGAAAATGWATPCATSQWVVRPSAWCSSTGRRGASRRSTGRPSSSAPAACHWAGHCAVSMPKGRRGSVEVGFMQARGRQAFSRRRRSGARCAARATARCAMRLLPRPRPVSNAVFCLLPAGH